MHDHLTRVPPFQKKEHHFYAKDALHGCVKKGGESVHRFSFQTKEVSFSLQSTVRSFRLSGSIFSEPRGGSHFSRSAGLEDFQLLAGELERKQFFPGGLRLLS